MATASVNIYFRTRRMWLARLVMYTGSRRLFAWAVGQFRVDMRTSERGLWVETDFRAQYDPATGRISTPWDSPRPLKVARWPDEQSTTDVQNHVGDSRPIR